VDNSPAAAGVSKFSTAVMLLAGTAVMLPLLFPPFYCFFLAPFALVPFCVCVLRRPMRKGFVLAYYGLGLAFFIPNLFWLGPVTVGGFIALAFFLAIYFPLFAVALHRLVVHLRVPATLAVPLAWVTLEYIRASYPLGGFPWFLLGNSFAPAPVLIQVADIFGVWGISFFIAMLNGFVVDVLRLPLRVPGAGRQGGGFSPAIQSLSAAAALATAFVLVYGIFRLQQQTTRPGPRIAVIQENIPQAIKDARDTRDDVYIRHLELSLKAATSTPRPAMVAWPETMVIEPINLELLRGEPDEFHTMEELRAALQLAAKFDFEGDRISDVYKSLTDQVMATKVPLLVGYGSYQPGTKPSPSVIQNRTLLLSPGATGAVRSKEYSKIHLVPFGEFIPFRGVPVLSRIMLLFSPVDFDYSNTPGTEWTRFDLGEGGEYKFGTPICFEDTMPEPCRQMTAPQYGGGRKADFLVNVSNDGWFQWVELDQHLQACQLRAVENRVAIARSVNTGNSGFIDSNGRVVKLVRDAGGSSIGAVGFESWEMPIDSRVTIFSRIGDLFPIIGGVVSTLLVAWTFVRPRRG
jgi:apolipoprotein N-acyltransferase